MPSRQLRWTGVRRKSGPDRYDPSAGERKRAQDVSHRVATAVAPSAPPWRALLSERLEAGFDWHPACITCCRNEPELVAAAEKHGRTCMMRIRRCNIPSANGLSNAAAKRVLAGQGTDCSVGKMYTAWHWTRNEGKGAEKAASRATGQTGYPDHRRRRALGRGLRIFQAGSIEYLTPDK